jgi:GrpE
MNDDFDSSPRSEPPASKREPPSTLGASSIYRLCEEVIALREMNNRQHKMFEQTLTKARDELQRSFNSFAGDTQRAYQQLRQELHGEKRISLSLLNELLEMGMDLEHIVSGRPAFDDAEALARWAEAIEVQSRKAAAALLRHGIHPYDAVIGSPYTPALHERVGARHVEGMGPLLVAEQRERGYASQQPEFVLRRPKVIVSE